MVAKKILIITVLAILLFSSLISPVSSIKIKNTSISEVKEPNDNKSPGSSLNNPTIYVKVKRIHALEPVDVFDEADFYLKVEINHMGQQTSPKPLKKNDNDIRFKDDYNWIASQEIYDNKNVVDITIQLWDQDSEWYDGSDDRLDIAPSKDDCTVDIRYDLRTGKWDGDDKGTGYSEGNNDESWDKCEIWFDIWHEGGDNGDELTVEINAPSTGKINQKIQLTATAHGGKPPYKKWHWVVERKRDRKTVATFDEQNPTYTFTEEGKYILFVYVRDQNNDYAEDWTTILITDDDNDPDVKKTYVVLVAGGTGSSKILDWIGGINLDGDFERDTQHGYNTFKKLGYTDDQIYWLSGAKKLGNADAKTTKTNVKNAILGWLKKKSTKETNCFIFISDHGSDFPGYPICVFPGRPYNIWEMIFAWELDSWLDKIEYHTCILVLEACYSGGFIKYCSEKNRIILTATDSKNPAYTGGEGAFVEPFFNELAKGSSYGKAWMAADEYIDRYPDDQNPQIDDNGDRKGHGTSSVDKLPLGGDGYLALETYP